MASSHRERLLPAQGLPQDRNSLRQAGKKLSRFRLPHSRYHMVDLMSLGPNFLGNAVATIVMAKWEGALDEPRLHRALDEGAVDEI